MMLKPIAALLLLCALGLPALAGGFSTDQKTEIEGVVKSYLMQHPEVIRDAIIALQGNEKKATEDTLAQLISNYANDIFHNPTDGVGGNPSGDVTLVEFMDFNCGVCKKTAPEVRAAIKADPKLRVVLKEWPVIGGPASEYTAKAVLAAQKQGKYWPMHLALYAHTGTVTPEVVDRVAKDIGVDVVKMKADMNDPAIQKTLAMTNRIATELQFSGTPSFVIGDQVIPGAASSAGLLEVVASVRANGSCKMC